MCAYKTTPPPPIPNICRSFFVQFELLRISCPLNFWQSPSPLTFTDVSCLSCTGCIYEPAYVHVPYASQAMLWIGHLIGGLFCFATELISSDVECPSRSPFKKQQAWSVLMWVINSSNKLCASNVTMKFAGLPLTCVEAVAYGCRSWKAPNIHREPMIRFIEGGGGGEGFFVKVY